jgi:photosystem II stability/assembly factor-like uncharacterized protein
LAKAAPQEQAQGGVGGGRPLAAGRGGAGGRITANTSEVAALTARRDFAGQASFQITSPISSSRWRISGSVVEHSTDGGATWHTTPTGVATPLTTGASPAANICWIVGRSGVVLLSSDGETWRRLPFPEAVDLTAVVARDNRSATVTAVDGRIFSTTNAGGTWNRGPLQGF